LADRISVLRDGKHISTQAASQFSRQKLIALMVGREVEALQRTSNNKGNVLLELDAISDGYLQNLSFKLHAGEVLGLAGLVGAGQTQLAELLFGLRKAASGKLRLEGQVIAPNSPHDAIAKGIAYVPEDRKDLGLVLLMSVQDNLTLAGLKAYSRAGILRLGKLKRSAQQWVSKLNIRATSLKQEVETLSGGNQQKVVLAKWLALNPKLLILNEPTRGIDVGAKAEVHKLIRETAAQGIAVLMISSELPELLGVSDRIMVMWRGQQMATLAAEDASEASVLALAFGQEAA
jgi:ABC-type sugar transport system ATPase subunit